MSEYSRVKKFAKLRQSLQEENESMVVSEALAPFARRLHQVDDDYKHASTLKEAHSPLHARNLAYGEVDNEVKDDEVISTFNNDDLDSFIDEVKRYNVKKGYRKAVDTRSHILHEFAPEIKQSSFQQEEEETDAVQDITQQIQLYTDEENHSVDQNKEDHPLAVAPIDWLEKTQQLSNALEEYESDLNEMNETVTNTNRLLNFVIGLLILALLSFMGVILWVLLGRGMI